MTDPQKIECLQKIFSMRFHAAYANIVIGKVTFTAPGPYYAQFTGIEASASVLQLNRVMGWYRTTKRSCAATAPTWTCGACRIPCKQFVSAGKTLTPKDLRVLRSRPERWCIGHEKMSCPRMPTYTACSRLSNARTPPENRLLASAAKVFLPPYSY